MGFQRVLVPFDAFGQAMPALSLAARAADASTGRVRLVHVRTWQPLPPPSREDGPFLPRDSELFNETPEEAAEVVDTACSELLALGVDADAIVLEGARPMVGVAVVTAAREWDAEVIVLCRRPRRALSVLVWGSVSEHVMRHAPCPVLLVRVRTP
jgi:nucleotide-binding universal stress UspA family protein